jgi:hypothetical protein
VPELDHPHRLALEDDDHAATDLRGRNCHM